VIKIFNELTVYKILMQRILFESNQNHFNVNANKTLKMYIYFFIVQQITTLINFQQNMGAILIKLACDISSILLGLSKHVM